MEVQSDYVILSGGSGIGYAFAMHLLSKNLSFTVFAQADEKIDQLLLDSSLVSLVYGSYEDPEVLDAALKNKKYVFLGRCSRTCLLHQRYAILMANIISIAVRYRLLLIYPGNVCQYQGGTLITSLSLPAPVTKLGDLETQMEDLLLQAAVELQCRVMIVRIPLLVGPNATDREIKQLFPDSGEKRKKRFPVWFPVSVDVLIPFAYAGDVAAFIFRLIHVDAVMPFRVFHYSGGEQLTVRELRDLISDVTGLKTRIWALSRWQLYLLSFFSKDWPGEGWRLNCFSTSFRLYGGREEEQLIAVDRLSLREAVIATLSREDFYNY